MDRILFGLASTYLFCNIMKNKNTSIEKIRFFRFLNLEFELYNIQLSTLKCFTYFQPPGTGNMKLTSQCARHSQVKVENCEGRNCELFCLNIHFIIYLHA